MRLLTIGLILIQCTLVSAGTVAVGNLAVTFQGKGYISSPENPLKGQMNDLWCQASDNGDHKDIGQARFVRVHDRKIFEAMVDDETKRAIRIFGNVPVTEAAKYRCEITTTDSENIFGNMFAYSHPVIHVNESWGVHRPENHEENELVAKLPVYTDVGAATAQLECPVVGYPHPNVVWYKDNLPIDPNSKYSMRHRGKSLTIRNITDSDAGIYRCKGMNTFPRVVDGEEYDNEVSLDIELKLNSRFGWLYPLIVIVVILILLFCIIYSCKAYGKWKSDQYNVAKREKQYRVDEEKKMVEEI